MKPNQPTHEKPEKPIIGISGQVINHSYDSSMVQFNTGCTLEFKVDRSNPRNNIPEMVEKIIKQGSDEKSQMSLALMVIYHLFSGGYMSRSDRDKTILRYKANKKTLPYIVRGMLIGLFRTSVSPQRKALTGVVYDCLDEMAKTRGPEFKSYYGYMKHHVLSGSSTSWNGMVNNFARYKQSIQIEKLSEQKQILILLAWEMIMCEYIAAGTLE
eukprot:94533_1